MTLIPARELALGMVQVEMQGVEGVCWVDPSHLQQSAYQHPPFDEETRAYLRQIKAALDEVYANSTNSLICFSSPCQVEGSFASDASISR